MYWVAVVIFLSFGGFLFCLFVSVVSESETDFFFCCAFWGLCQRSQEGTVGRVVVGEVRGVVGCGGRVGSWGGG